jgi:hypothetical protein
MKRFLGGLALVAALSLGAGAAHAQIFNMPVFFSPAFGTGVGIYGDVGMGLNDDAKFDTGPDASSPMSYGGHVVLGLSKFTIMAGVASFDSKVTGLDKELSYGGNLGLTIYRTPASMVVVNIQAGAGYIKFGDAATGEVKQWNFPIGVGLALDLPVVGWFVEPWIAPRVHIFSTDDGTGSQTDVGFGVSGGINANLLLGIGAWAALDWLTITPGTATESIKPLVLGLGLSWKFSVPGLGMASGLVGG